METITSNSSTNSSTILPSVEDVAKWLAVFVSILSIYAWLGGQSYDLGYWRLVGWNGSIVKPSIQETAFNGFVGPFLNWWGAVAFMFALGCFGLIAEFWSSRSTSRLPRAQASPFQLWIRRGKKIDLDSLRFFGGSLLGGLLFASVILIPMTFWVISGLKSGRDAATEEICLARRSQYLPSTLTLANGTTINGRFLDRSDKLSILLDRTSIYVVLVGENPRILDRTDLARINCAK